MSSFNCCDPPQEDYRDYLLVELLNHLEFRRSLHDL